MPLLRSSMVVAFCLLLLSLALGARGPQLAAQFRSQEIADALLTSYQSAIA